MPRKPDDRSARDSNFFMGDDAQTQGIVHGTKVATKIGWCRVEDVFPGDKVLTFDGGFQVCTRIERNLLWHGNARDCPLSAWPLHVPAGALGNQSAMLLLPDQPIMVESDTAEEILGDPFTLMPAAALDGFRGIERSAPADRVWTVSLCFDTDQVVFANIGALFFCPKVLSGDLTFDIWEADPSKPAYSILSMDEAITLRKMIEEREDS